MKMCPVVKSIPFKTNTEIKHVLEQMAFGSSRTDLGRLGSIYRGPGHREPKTKTKPAVCPSSFLLSYTHVEKIELPMEVSITLGPWLPGYP